MIEEVDSIFYMVFLLSFTVLVIEVRSSHVGKIWFEISLQYNFPVKLIDPWKAQPYAPLIYIKITGEKAFIFSKGFKTYLPLYFIHLMYLIIHYFCFKFSYNFQNDLSIV